jgi:hypothetical protein
MNVRRLGRGKLVVDYVHVKAKGHWVLLTYS